MPKDVHRALEHLEAFHAELIRPSDAELRHAIEKVIAIFKTNLFNALVDIQEFYDNTLLNDRISFVQKCIASRRFAERWEQNPPFSSGYVRTSIPVTAVKPSYDSYSLGRAELNYPVTTSTPLTNGILSKSYSPVASYKTKNRIVDEQGREWEVEEIDLDTSIMGLGFSISGGIDRDPEPDYYIRITEILPDGVVARDGRVKLGDVILKVNNIDCANVPHETAVKALQMAGPVVTLLIKRLKNQRSLSQSHLADTVYRRTEEEKAWGTIGPPPARSRKGVKG
uniref:Uncharacterized protein n=1 Tax=Acrobeloides nanus TaxID=290746 RepID=A0A914D1Z2_9BILA